MTFIKLTFDWQSKLTQVSGSTSFVEVSSDVDTEKKKGSDYYDITMIAACRLYQWVDEHFGSPSCLACVLA